MPANKATAPIKIIAFDPGGTTGYCIHCLYNKGVWGGSNFDYQKKWSGGQLGPGAHHTDLWKLLTGERPDHVVHEAFNYQIRRQNNVQMPGVQLISRNYIGIIELYCALMRTRLTVQQPSILKTSWCEDKALKKLGLYTVGEPHRNDAARHMLYYLVQNLGRSDYLTSLR